MTSPASFLIRLVWSAILAVLVFASTLQVGSVVQVGDRRTTVGVWTPSGVLGASGM